MNEVNDAMDRLVERHPELRQALMHYDAEQQEKTRKAVLAAETELIRRLLTAPEVVLRAGAYHQVLGDVHTVLADVQLSLIDEVARLRQSVDVILRAFVSLEEDATRSLGVDPELRDKAERAQALVEQAKRLTAMLEDKEWSAPLTAAVEEERRERNDRQTL